MAKAKFDIGLSLKPKMPKNLEGFVLITPENRKTAIVIGRILYTIHKGKLVNYDKIGPCFKRGWYEIPHFPWNTEHPYVQGKTHFKMWSGEESNFNAWKDMWKDTIDKGIADKTLYIRLTDPILTYKHQPIK